MTPALAYYKLGELVGLAPDRRRETFQMDGTPNPTVTTVWPGDPDSLHIYYRATLLPHPEDYTVEVAGGGRLAVYFTRRLWGSITLSFDAAAPE